MVVTDPALRAAIGDFYRRGASEYLAAGMARARTDEQRRVASSSVYLLENLAKVPVHVLACTKGRPPVGENQAGFYGWTTLHLAYEREVAELLGIPDNVTQVALLPVAYTIGLDFKPAARQPVERFTYWNRYGDTAPPVGNADSA